MPKKLTQEEFIERVKNIFPNYLFEKVNYVNNNTKVEIICPVHGSFKIIPRNLLSGVGCPVCGGSKVKSTDEFIAEANLVHGNRYDYSKVKYINYNTKVEIICPVHGSFWQTPKIHLKGCNCQQCSRSSGELKIAKILAENNIPFEIEKLFQI